MSASIVCTNCGAEGESNFSTNYFGELVCELCGTQSYLQTRTETQDAEDMGLDLLALQKMKRRTKRKRRERKIKVVEEKKPVQLLDCIVVTQFILNEQAEALVQIGFPPEFPRAVRDIWFHFLQVWQTKGARPFLRCFTEFHYTAQPEDKSMDPAVTSEVLEQWDAENATNLERLFQPSQSTIREDDVDTGVTSLRNEFKGKVARDWQHKLDWFTLPDLVGILVLAGRMLSVGAMPCDYAHWIQRGELPFYNVLSLCPLEMQLSVERVANFFGPSLRANWISAAVVAFKAHYLQFHLEIHLPPLNASLVAFNMCENLGLPAQVFRNFQYVSAQFNLAGTLLEKPIQQRMATRFQDTRGSALDSASGIAAYLLVAIRLCPNWTEWIYERVRHREQHEPPYFAAEADLLPRRELGAFVEFCESMLLGDDRGRIPDDFVDHVDELKTRLSGHKSHYFSRKYETSALRAYMPAYENGICVETPEQIQQQVDHVKQKLRRQRAPHDRYGDGDDGGKEEEDNTDEQPVTPTYFYPLYSKFERSSFHGPFEAALELLAEYIDSPMGAVLRWVDAIDGDMKKRAHLAMNDATGVTAMQQLTRLKKAAAQRKQELDAIAEAAAKTKYEALGGADEGHEEGLEETKEERGEEKEEEEEDVQEEMKVEEMREEEEMNDGEEKDTSETIEDQDDEGRKRRNDCE